MGDQLVPNPEYRGEIMEVVERSHNMLAYEVLPSRQEEQRPDIPLLTEFERQQLEAWNATQQDYPQDACVPQLVAMQAAASPGAMAVAAGDQVLSYRELNRRA